MLVLKFCAITEKHHKLIMVVRSSSSMISGGVEIAELYKFGLEISPAFSFVNTTRGVATDSYFSSLGRMPNFS
jgi:hypothetical protein